MATPKHLNLGVYIPTSVQLLDLSPIDILGMLDPKYLAACQLPAPIIALGIPSTIHYISVPSSGPHVELTASALIRVSKTIDDPDVQPGKLDVLLIPGPDPATIFEEEALQFVRAHATWANNCGKKADILSICTGCILLAQSGVVKGKNANGPRAVIPMLRQKYPDVKWIDDKRWTRDGNIWSSGGITNGQEMVAAYIRANFHGPMAEAVIAMAGVGDKGIDYSSGKAQETAWWLWQIFKAWCIGKKKTV